MAKKESEQPFVTHLMADGSSLSSIGGYLTDFHQLPQVVQDLIVQLTLGPICHDPPKE